MWCKHKNQTSFLFYMCTYILNDVAVFATLTQNNASQSADLVRIQTILIVYLKNKGIKRLTYRAFMSRIKASENPQEM